MKKGFIILAIVLVIALYILNKVSTARQLEYTVGVPKNVSVRGAKLTFDLPIQVRNVSQGSIRVKSADVDVFAGSTFLGKAILNEPVTIAPASTTVMLMGVTVESYDLLSVAGSIYNLFKTSKTTLTLNGLVYAEGLQVPIKQSFEFTIPKI